MWSMMSGPARASAERPREGGEGEARVVARASGAPTIQRTLGNRIAGLLAELAQPEALEGAAAQAAARRGLVGAGQELPHLAAIQRSFGRYDVRGVSAHAGAAAQAAAQSLGAAAYTSGEQVAFAGAPDLRTAAHEAAHVIQQRAGIDLPGGIDRPGDRFERHADAVAERVVEGRSAEPLLDALAGPRAATGRPAGAAGPVQRLLSIKATELAATRYRPWFGKPKEKHDDLQEVIELLREYEANKDPWQERKLLKRLERKLQGWVRPTRMPGSRRLRRRVDLLAQLEAEVARDFSSLQWSRAYMEDGTFKYLGNGAQKHGFDATWDIWHAVNNPEEEGELSAGDRAARPPKETVEFVREYGLTPPEIAAIRLFTLNDYLYINPAAADDRGRLRQNFPGQPIAADDPKRGKKEAKQERALTERMEEGRLHVAMMLEGLAKLPPWSGRTFRGERLTPEKFDELYTRQATITFKSFASMSTKKSTADTFALGNHKTGRDATVSVVVKFDVNYGRDISKLSKMPGEKEVLLLPGAEFEIRRITQLPRGPAGQPAATAWYEVELVQTRPGPPL